jgi:hypothetical protein
MKVPKFAFVGSSSAGKTTLTYQVCGELKLYGVRVDGILQQDRRLPFDSALLESRFEAQEWFLGNMIQMESYMSLQSGVDMIVSDRSLVDFFCYMKTQWGDSVHAEKVRMWEQLVRAHVSSYEYLFYCAPLPYDNDGVRPNEEFIKKVDTTLLGDFGTLCTHTPRNSKIVSEDIILSNTLRILGCSQCLGEDAYLTGSWARGGQSRGSDIDLFMSISTWRKKVAASLEAEGRKAVWVASETKRNDPGCIGVFRISDTRPVIEVQVFEDDAMPARIKSQREG